LPNPLFHEIDSKAQTTNQIALHRKILWQIYRTGNLPYIPSVLLWMLQTM